MKKIVLGLAFLPVLFFSCSSDDDTGTEAENEEELITDVTLTLTPVDGGDPLVFSWIDEDGDDEVDSIDTIELTAGVTYTGAITLYNSVEDEDVTEEIEDEADEHQFFYTVTEADMEVAYTDSDANGYPIGLEFTVDAVTASTGTLNVLLLHQPDKTAEGVSDGDSTNAGGDIDIDIDFPVTIN